jgi:hypothetical protein
MRFVIPLLVLVMMVATSGCLVDNASNVGNGSDSSRTDSLTALADTLLEDVDLDQNDTVSDTPIRHLIQVRKQRGDTSVLSIAALKELLPTQWQGFGVVGDVEGETVNLEDMGVKLSTIKLILTRGGQRLEVKLTDLNCFPSKLVAVWKVGKREVHFNSRSERNHTWRLGESAAGFERLRPLEGKATIDILVGNRFEITLDGTGFSETETLKKLVEAFNLDKMRQLGAAAN